MYTTFFWKSFCSPCGVQWCSRDNSGHPLSASSSCDRFEVMETATLKNQEYIVFWYVKFPMEGFVLGMELMNRLVNHHFTTHPAHPLHQISHLGISIWSFSETVAKTLKFQTVQILRAEPDGTRQHGDLMVERRWSSIPDHGSDPTDHGPGFDPCSYQIATANRWGASCSPMSWWANHAVAKLLHKSTPTRTALFRLIHILVNHIVYIRNMWRFYLLCNFLRGILTRHFDPHCNQHLFQRKLEKTRSNQPVFRGAIEDGPTPM